VRLALDAMGGDHAPGAIVQGAIAFAGDYPEHEVVLVGQERRIREALHPHPAPSNLSVCHASEVIEMGEHPGSSIRKKKDSSLRLCFDLLRRKEADAMVSAGNSGAVMAGALMVLGRIKGVERPAFAALFPSLKGGGRCLLLDAGANTECKPTQLAQFATLGEAYVRVLLGVARPRVGILSNGREPTKGNELTREALGILKRSDLDFVGYVEGSDIFSGEVEVVVTDGFTGNVVLKTSEGAAMAVAGMVRQAVERAGISEKLGVLLLKPTLAGLRKVVDYAEYGGAPLLGVAGVAIVAHGRSNPKAVKNALKGALQTAQAQLQRELSKRIEAARSWLPAAANKTIRKAAGESFSK
jgi:glycerol-3-phosphate acyltransferase PlsX